MRWMLIVGCVVATLAALNQARPNAARDSRISGRAGGVPEAATSGGRPIALVPRNQLPPLRTNPFAPRAEPSPPPAAPSPQVEGPPPGHQVPPMPYRFAGKVVYDGKLRVALTAGDRIHLVLEGDAVEGGYVVRKISADKVTLVYTPLGIDHELAYVAEASAPAAAPVAAPVQSVAAPVQMAGEVTAAPQAQQPAPPGSRQ